MLFQVVCDTDDAAPVGESFCETDPVIRPQGGGLYLVEFTTGAICAMSIHPDGQARQESSGFVPQWR
eukprot:1161312-Pelagomonas_calceolata.AAC.6